jgi:hypothetical protein
MAETAITVFTACPFATVNLDDEADGATLEALATALDGDPRALGPAYGYDVAPRQLSAIFQVEAPNREDATDLALRIFDDGLRQVGAGLITDGWSVVEGGDPDLLP